MAEAFAAMRKEKNSKAVEAARREYEQFVQELDRGHQNINCCLRVKPEEMKRRLEGKRRELLKHCQGQLWGEDPQKQAALKVLEQGLAGKTSKFLTAYGQRFKEKAVRLGLYIGGSVLALVGAGVVAGISPSLVVKVGAGGLVLIRRMVGRWVWG
ncbi:RING finger protein 112-like [Terrapene carolina triunguis]|uniref:RING finger protein 112-like n=1 Tax=Terrapene triunguis TaxID=2587831 RepID=UPI000E777205|nr:RING finger protein 112-like [Terrapene carolina triunguis]